MSMTEVESGKRQTSLSNRLLVRNTFLNLAGQIAPMMSALFAIPFIIRGLGISRFGVLSLVWVVIGYFSLFDLGLGRALTQLVAEKLGKEKEDEVPSLVWTSLIFMLVLGGIGTLALALFAPRLVYDVLDIPTELQLETLKSLYLLSLAIPIIVINSGFRGALEARQCFGLLNLIRVPYGIFTFVSPLFVLPFSSSLYPVIAVAVVGRLLFCLAHLYFCFQVFPSLKANFIVEWKAISPLFRFGSWMTITNIVGPLMVYIDRFFIGVFISVTAVAYYTTPFEIVTKLWIIPGAAVSVLFPAFATSFVQDQSHTANLFIRGVKYIYLTLFPIILILIGFGHEALNFWLGEEYAQNSTFILQIIAIGLLVNSAAQIPFALIQGIGRPDLTAKLHLLELPFYILSLWYIGLKWGISGVAFTWLVRVIIDAVVLFIFAKRLLDIDMKSLRAIAFLSIATLIASACLVLITGLALKQLLLLTFLLVFAITGWSIILSPFEQIFICNYIKKLHVAFQRGILIWRS